MKLCSRKIKKEEEERLKRFAVISYKSLCFQGKRNALLLGLKRFRLFRTHSVSSVILGYLKGITDGHGCERLERANIKCFNGRFNKEAPAAADLQLVSDREAALSAQINLNIW